jgi:lactate 2-monooxygenase
VHNRISSEQDTYLYQLVTQTNPIDYGNPIQSLSFNSWISQDYSYITLFCISCKNHINMTSQRPKLDPVDYEKEVYQKGLEFERPPFTFKSLEWESLARERMSAESAGYVIGNAGTGETARKNREAFGKWSIVPKRLVKTNCFPTLTTTVLGKDVQFPFAMAPVGVNKIFHTLGEIAAAKAAARENVPYIMSTASSTSIEEVAKANGDGTRWFQLYWPSSEHDDITISILQRAKKAGFSALFVTLDTYMLGWRPSDMDNGLVQILRTTFKARV